MENQTIKSIENYISNELKGLNGQELLNQVSRFVNEVDEDIDALFENHFADMAIEYFEDIMLWHEEDMYNNPEEYGTTAEEIEEYEVRWDEDGIEYCNWNQYFKELIQEGMEAANFEIAESIKEAMDNDCHMDWSDCKTAFYFATHMDYDGDTDVQVNLTWLTEDNELQIYADRGYYNYEGFQTQEILPATQITINDIPMTLTSIRKKIAETLEQK